MKDLHLVDLGFELSRPFDPYAQLLSVLPPLSSALMPEPLAALMTADTSPLKPFYPTVFDIDTEGTRSDWEVSLEPVSAGLESDDCDFLGRCYPSVYRRRSFAWCL